MGSNKSINMKKIIKEGGGIYRGIQHIISGNHSCKNQNCLVLFDTPFGTTLAIIISKLSVKKVREKIQESNIKFKK